MQLSAALPFLCVSIIKIHKRTSKHNFWVGACVPLTWSDRGENNSWIKALLALTLVQHIDETWAQLCVCVYTVCACVSLSQCVCQRVVLNLGAVTASVCCLRDIRDHVRRATSKRAESWCWPQGLGVDNVRQLGAGEMQWHMLSDRETPGCCRAERGRRFGGQWEWQLSGSAFCVCESYC